MLKAMTILSALVVANTVWAADWPAFRGPAGDGISAAKEVPTDWSAEQGIAWRVSLPGKSNGSPIVSGTNIFLTSAENSGRDRHLHCFSTADGKERWRQTVTVESQMPTHKTNQYGGTTPATDGSYVVVWHSTGGLHCYDLEGSKLWNRDFGEFRHQWGYGTSPVIFGDKVILHSGPGHKVFVAAVNLQSGAVEWQTEEPVENDGERNDDNKYMGSWSTPVIVETEEKTLAVCSLSTRTNAYDLQTGEIVWTCGGLRGPRGDLAYTSPVIAGNICVAMGGFKGPASGFRMTGQGDITTEHMLWREEQNPQRIGSGIFVNGHIYMGNAGPNTLQCLDPMTGSVVWEERGLGGAYWGSLVYADEKIYATDQNNNTLVFKPDSAGLKRLAVNKLDDPGNSTPAVTDGSIYIRSFQHLYRISHKK